MNRPRRPLLTSVAALGGVITLASTTGVFAVFTDRATTGTNTFATKGLPGRRICSWPSA
jgi:predicted ribosomally synthesized peptide with SipW-like signal peptide